MTDDERKQEDTEEIKGGALQSYLNLEGKKQGKIENPQSSR